jgi:hypothetical protein
LEFLWAHGRLSERRLRLFGCACYRAVWELFTDARSRQAADVVERYADGAATGQEMEEAERASSVARDLAGPASDAPRRHRSRLGRSTSWAAHALTNVPPDDGNALRFVWEDVREASAHAADVRGRVRELRRLQAVLLRDLFGNPFRPLPAIDPSWLTPTVVAIGRRAYDERDFTALPVLADALQESGCENEVILGHGRGQRVHARGCWLVDLLLGKS